MEWGIFFALNYHLLWFFPISKLCRDSSRCRKMREKCKIHLVKVLWWTSFTPRLKKRKKGHGWRDESQQYIYAWDVNKDVGHQSLLWALEREERRCGERREVGKHSHQERLQSKRRKMKKKKKREEDRQSKSSFSFQSKEQESRVLIRRVSPDSTSQSLCRVQLEPQGLWALNLPGQMSVSAHTTALHRPVYKSR